MPMIAVSPMSPAMSRSPHACVVQPGRVGLRVEVHEHLAALVGRELHGRCRPGRSARTRAASPGVSMSVDRSCGRSRRCLTKPMGAPSSAPTPVVPASTRRSRPGPEIAPRVHISGAVWLAIGAEAPGCGQSHAPQVARGAPSVGSAVGAARGRRSRPWAGRGRGSGRGCCACCRRRSARTRSARATTSASRACSVGLHVGRRVGSWLFHTTIGTAQISHSAIQHRSSSWNHAVIRAASHRSQSAMRSAATAGVVTLRRSRRGPRRRRRRPRPGRRRAAGARPRRPDDAVGHLARPPRPASALDTPTPTSTGMSVTAFSRRGQRRRALAASASRSPVTPSSPTA